MKGVLKMKNETFNVRGKKGDEYVSAEGSIDIYENVQEVLDNLDESSIISLVNRQRKTDSMNRLRQEITSVETEASKKRKLVANLTPDQIAELLKLKAMKDAGELE